MDYTAIIAAVSAAAILIIGAIASGIVLIIKELGATKRQVVQAAAEGAHAVAASTKTLSNIEILVDGRYSAVLQELANVKALLAASTNQPFDKLRASQAQEAANVQRAAVDAMLKEKEK